MTIVMNNYNQLSKIHRKETHLKQGLELSCFLTGTTDTEEVRTRM